jgi:hypothetical protein
MPDTPDADVVVLRMAALCFSFGLLSFLLERNCPNAPCGSFWAR